MKTLLVAIFVSCFVFAEQKSGPQDDHYIGAVVEYVVNRESDANLDKYIELIKEAAEKNADIIVFPEMTLTRIVSMEVPIYGALKDDPVPALKPELYNRFLVQLSEAAMRYQIYTIVNIEELLNCTTAAAEEECPDNGIYRFNTNVVFNRYGAIVDRYRKINLFGEMSRTPAFKPDLGVFSTDFGVTFGHFICHLIFQVPAIQVVQKFNITNVAFPTMWFSELPYLTAVQIQEAYAYAENINFLAAGANNVLVGSAGSGIYSGKAGALTSIMPGSPTTRLLVAKIPKIPGKVMETHPGHENDDPNILDSLLLIQDPSMPAHLSRLLEPGSHDFTFNDADVTCRFKINFRSESSENVYYYRAGILDGIRTYSGFASGGVRTCSIFACTNSTIQGCGLRFPEYAPGRTATFEQLIITATVPKPRLNATLNALDTAYFPVSSDESLMPLKTQYYTFKETVRNERAVYELSLVNKEVGLLGFAVWGRVYDKDGGEPTGERDSAAASRLNVLLLVLMFILSIFRL